jgi:hypothetical protein
MDLLSEVAFLQRAANALGDVSIIHIQLIQGGSLTQSMSQFILVTSAEEAVSCIQQRTNQLMIDEALTHMVQSDDAVQDSRCLTIGFRTGTWPALRCITFTLVAPLSFLAQAARMARDQFGGMHSTRAIVAVSTPPQSMTIEQVKETKAAAAAAETVITSKPLEHLPMVTTPGNDSLHTERDRIPILKPEIVIQELASTPNLVPELKSDPMPACMSKLEVLPILAPELESMLISNTTSESSPKFIPPELVPQQVSSPLHESLAERLPVQLPGQLSESLPELLPDQVPESLSERLSEELPERLIESLPERLADMLPETVSDQLPELLPAPSLLPDPLSTHLPVIVRSSEVLLPPPPPTPKINDDDAVFDQEEVAPTGRSHCHACRGLIERGTLRVRRTTQRSTRALLLHRECVHTKK